MVLTSTVTHTDQTGSYFTQNASRPTGQNQYPRALEQEQNVVIETPQVTKDCGDIQILALTIVVVRNYPPDCN